MNLGNKDPEGQDWSPNGPQEIALHKLGADSVAFGNEGHVFVEPYIDLEQYSDKLSEATEEWLMPRVKEECHRRIIEKISETAQRNIIAYSTKLIKDAHVLEITLTEEQQNDLETADAIWGWINSGMLEICRELIQNKDLEYSQDDKWPAWDNSWSGLVDRF